MIQKVCYRTEMELNMKECGKKANNMVEVTFFILFVFKFDNKMDSWSNKGKCSFIDGSEYEGEWKRGLIHGDGNKNNNNKRGVVLLNHVVFYKICC